MEKQALPPGKAPGNDGTIERQDTLFYPMDMDIYLRKIVGMDKKGQLRAILIKIRIHIFQGFTFHHKKFWLPEAAVQLERDYANYSSKRDIMFLAQISGQIPGTRQ